MTATHAGFLADIIEHPADDVPRLIYADWLEEHDERMYAGFIRDQIAGKKRPITSEQFRRWFRPWWGMGVSFTMSHSKGQTNANIGAGGSGGGNYVPPPRIIVRRGFVCEVHMTLHNWLRHPDGGPAIAAAHPVETVRLTCRIPRRSDGDSTKNGFYWYADQEPWTDWTCDDDTSVLPRAWLADEPSPGLGRVLRSPCFPTPEAAHALASERAILWAREKGKEK